MTWILISGVVLIVFGAFTAGVACGPRVLARLMPAEGSHRAPAHEIDRAFEGERITTPLLSPAQVTGHVDAMWQASEPYLPPSPQGEHPCPPYVPAWMPIERKQTEDHAPWTGSQPVLDAGAYEAEQRRVALVRSQLPERAEDVTREDMERALAGLRALPVYGEAPVLAVDEAQRAAERVIA